MLNNKTGSDAHVFDLKLLKELYLVFWIYHKISSIRELSIGEGKFHKKKKTVLLILLGVQLLRISTDQMTSSPEMRK